MTTKFYRYKLSGEIINSDIADSIFVCSKHLKDTESKLDLLIKTGILERIEKINLNDVINLLHLQSKRAKADIENLVEKSLNLIKEKISNWETSPLAEIMIKDLEILASKLLEAEFLSVNDICDLIEKNPEDYDESVCIEKVRNLRSDVLLNLKIELGL